MAGAVHRTSSLAPDAFDTEICGGAGGTCRTTGTVTTNVCTALGSEPYLSAAVTVIVVAPAASGVTVTVEPDTDTVATPGADDAAAYLRTSPSGSRNASATGTATGPSPRRAVSAGSVPTASGGRLTQAGCSILIARALCRSAPSASGSGMNLIRIPAERDDDERDGATA